MKVISIKDVPLVGVSHNKEIKKQVILEKGYVPNLNTFGKAYLKPGQSVGQHVHENIFEIFYVLSGKAIFEVEGIQYEITPDQCISIEPGENHDMSNPFNEDVAWIYFAIKSGVVCEA